MKKILVVEDNSYLRQEIVEILTMENFKVYEAENGFVGIKLAKEKIPDLIISDILMPECGGFSMLKAIKDNTKTKRIPIIFMSAKTSSVDIRKGMDIGGYDYLTKPFKINELLKSIQGVLKKIEEIESDAKKLKIELTRILPHELKTPLNAILGFSELLLTKYKEFSKEEVKQVSKYIYDGTIRLSKLIERYLFFAQLEILKIKPQADSPLIRLSEICTSEVINKIVQDEFANAKRINDLNINLAPVQIKFNKYMFEKIISETISNAIKFSNIGEKIFVSFKRTDKFTVLTVKNEGIGMKDIDIQNIRAFMQFDSNKQDQQGSGIGLTIVKSISFLTNIEISIQSVYHKYFCITIYFKNTKSDV